MRAVCVGVVRCSCSAHITVLTQPSTTRPAAGFINGNVMHSKPVRMVETPRNSASQGRKRRGLDGGRCPFPTTLLSPALGGVQASAATKSAAMLPRMISAKEPQPSSCAWPSETNYKRDIREATGRAESMSSRHGTSSSARSGRRAFDADSRHSALCLPRRRTIRRGGLDHRTSVQHTYPTYTRTKNKHARNPPGPMLRRPRTGHEPEPFPRVSVLASGVPNWRRFTSFLAPSGWTRQHGGCTWHLYTVGTPELCCLYDSRMNASLGVIVVHVFLRRAGLRGRDRTVGLRAAATIWVPGCWRSFSLFCLLYRGGGAGGGGAAEWSREPFGTPSARVPLYSLGERRQGTEAVRVEALCFSQHLISRPLSQMCSLFSVREREECLRSPSVRPVVKN